MHRNINTARLLIRPLKDCDLFAFQSAVNDSISLISPWIEWCQSPFDDEETQRWIKLSQQHFIIGNSFEFGLFCTKTEALIGAVTLDCINTFFNQANLGYWVSKPFINKGYAREAVEAVKSFAFHQLGLTRLELIIHPENIASLKVAESIDAKKECLAHNKLYFKQRPIDAWVYSLTPEN